MKQLKEHGRPITKRIEEKNSSDSCSHIVATKTKNKELLKKKNGCQTFLFNFFLLNFLLPFCLLLPPTSGQYQVYREDPFAMLSATLQVIRSFPYIFDCIYLLFCIVYILLELFYSSNGISILTNSLLLEFYSDLPKGCVWWTGNQPWLPIRNQNCHSTRSIWQISSLVRGKYSNY